MTVADLKRISFDRMSPGSPVRSVLRPLLPLLLIAAGFFACTVPILSWAQFSGDSEDLVVEPVLEMHRGGPWWVPTLGGEPRIRKPPLTTWISAAAVSHATMAQLGSADPALRDAAYRRLAFEVRWPALLAGCLMLVAVGLTGQLICGGRAGLYAALICGSSYFFLRFCRSTTTDIHLALWVSVTNLCLAAAVLNRRYWAGFVGGGVALGLALMSKGPAALVETVVPVLMFVLFRWRSSDNLRRQPGNSAAERIEDASENPSEADSLVEAAAPGPLVPLLIGIGLMLVIGFSWYVSAVRMYPGAAKVWANELSSERGTGVSHDSLFTYLILFPYMLPWMGFFIAGGAAACRELRANQRIALPLFLIVVPVLVLSFFHDRKDRYLLPMLGPAAIVAAYGVAKAQTIGSEEPELGVYRESSSNPEVWSLHWITVGLFALCAPIAGMVLKTPAGERWVSIPVGCSAIAAGAALVGFGIIVRRRSPLAAVIVSALVMLLLHPLLMHGWVRSTSGLSEMKPIADRIRTLRPDAAVVYYDDSLLGKPVTLDLDIYLGRSVRVFRDVKFLPADAAVVMLQEGTAPAPTLPGRETLFAMMSRKHHWYVLEPIPR